MLLIKYMFVTPSVYVRFGPYSYKYFCLLHGPTVMLLNIGIYEIHFV